MTKEELFRINFPEYCTKKECLSPYYDIFEAGVVIATCEMNKITVQPLQNHIAELTEENRALVSGQQLLKETLEKKIEKMKCCENCKNNDKLPLQEPCYFCARCYGKTHKKLMDNWELAE